MDYSHTQKQANARQPTNQERRHRSVEIGDSDRDGDPKADKPSRERATAILRREPLQLGDCTNCNHDPQDAAEGRSGE